jgi:hypothetical protein
MRNDLPLIGLRAATAVALAVTFVSGCGPERGSDVESSKAQLDIPMPNAPPSRGCPQTDQPAHTTPQANDLNIGAHNPEGDQIVKLSIRVEPGETRFRFAPYPNELLCSKFRKELCGIEQRVTLIEGTVPNKTCRIDNPTLATCTLGLESSAAAVLDDGTRVSLPALFGRLQVGQQTAIETDAQGALVPRTRITLDVDIWGSRADGLDPLVVNEKPGIFVDVNWEVLTKSLF